MSIQRTMRELDGSGVLLISDRRIGRLLAASNLLSGPYRLSQCLYFSHPAMKIVGNLQKAMRQHFE